MNSSRYLLLVVLALAALSGTALLLLRNDDGRHDPDSDTDGGGVVSESRADPGVESLDDGGLPERIGDGARDTSRQQVAGPALRCRVRDRIGSPIEGALISWSHDPGSRSGEAEAFPSVDVEALLQHAVWSETGAEGVAEFEEEPKRGGLEGSIVWVSHPGHRAKPAVLQDLREERTQTLTFVLEEAAPIGVRVVDSGDNPVPHARVYQLGVSMEDARALGFRGRSPRLSGMSASALETAARAFWRAYDTDGDGHVEVVTGEWPSAVWARSGEEISSISLVQPEGGRITLELGSPISVAGSVLMSQGGNLPEGLHVLCRWKGGGEWKNLGSAIVHQSGKWGPHDLPARSVGNYHFSLIGGGLVVKEAALPAPIGPGVVHVDFEAEIGVQQEVQVVDDEGVPIADAFVQVIWKQEDLWARAKAQTDEDGLAIASGCMSTTSWVRASKEGYVESTIDGVTVPRPVEDVVVTLPRASRLSGRVTCEGEPVTDFYIHTWTDDVLQGGRSVFSDREDGRFQLASVQSGQVKIMASSATLPESEVQTIAIEIGQEAHVDIELEEGVLGRGVVVDAVTGDPLQGAVVGLQTCYRTQYLGPRGPGQAVGPTGRFTLEGVSTGESAVLASMVGYVDAYAHGSRAEDGNVDFGVVSLARRGTLEVQLVGDMPLGEGAVWFLAQGKTGNNIPYTRVPQNGHLEIPDVAPGMYTAVLMYEDASTQSRTEHLTPGTPWKIEFPFFQGHSVTVNLQREDRGALPPVEVWVWWVDAGGQTNDRAALIETGNSTTLHNMPSGEVSITVIDAATREVLAVAFELLEPPSPQVVNLLLREHSLRVRVHDSEGRPRPKAWVFVGATSGDSHWVCTLKADSRGTAEFRGLDLDSVRICAHEAGLGLSRKDIQLSTSKVLDVEMILGDGEDLVVVVSDGDDLVVGAELRAVPDGFKTDSVLSGSTNQKGTKTWPSIAHGDYRIRLSRYGYWPTTHTIHFTGQPSTPLPIRRRGKLEAIMTSQSATPIPGALLTLHSAEFDTTVAAWLAEGKLESSAAALQSDAEGRVFAHGIPHGVYDWTATAPDGSRATGRITIPPGDTLEISFSIGG
jgi:hypothetical protein